MTTRRMRMSPSIIRFNVFIVFILSLSSTHMRPSPWSYEIIIALLNRPTRLVTGPANQPVITFFLIFFIYTPLFSRLN